MKPLSLYIHIPFCEQKCNYCDFLSFPAQDGVRSAYLTALKHELLFRAKDFGKEGEDAREIISAYIGGGTPSVLEADQIDEILRILYTYYEIAKDCEISMEVNPGTVDFEKLKAYRVAGINRLSIGCQSMQDEELQKLGRIHTKEDIHTTYQAAREAGFTNINIDLMSALPDQSFDDYIDSVAQVVDLQPEHISAYALILEEGTPFYEEYSEEVRDEDLDLEMYEETCKYLTGHGYEQYEISNYARKCESGCDTEASGQEACTPLQDHDYRCRHNVVYWKRGEYLGLGLGASSLISETRFRNTEDIDAYIAADGNADTMMEDMEVLNYHARMEEFMFLGLRMTEGISIRDFEETFHHPIRRIYAKAIDNLVSDGLLTVEGDRISLTRTGINVSNYALAQFLFDE